MRNEICNLGFSGIQNTHFCPAILQSAVKFAGLYNRGIPTGQCGLRFLKFKIVVKKQNILINYSNMGYCTQSLRWA